MVLHPQHGCKSIDMSLPETDNSSHKVHEQSWQLEMRALKGGVKRRGGSNHTASDKRVDPSVSPDKTRS